ncbi:MAG: chromosome segregation protein ScpA [Chloroflexi bacterium HGW-Chloroflexi-1]|nr:MAG: chromosome segregation protein ScpA [Chloroflexi bacterium HGW-Chloroflexi-1]
MLSSLRDTPYEVHLPVFEGPLDLLLQLIEREKLDISTVSLAQVADQFLAHVQALERVQAGALADFLVLAARLVWIKSRLLLPQPAQSDEEEEEDPAEALARQLQEYKRFKEVANLLRAIEERGQHAYIRIAPPPELERRLGEGEMTVGNLFAAAQAAFANALPPPIPDGVVVAPLILTIRDQIQLIKRVTAGGKPVTFRSLLQRARHRLEIIVTLLAVLELIKRRQVNAAQDALFGEIAILPIEGVEITFDGATDGGQNGNGNGLT